MTAPEESGELLVTVRVPALPARLALVRRLVSGVVTAVGGGTSCVRDIQLAVDEACQNVIRHAYQDGQQGEIIIDVFRVADRLVIDVVDFAAPVDVSRVRPRPLEELRPGGLGTHFIAECMDEARFCAPPEGAGNRLRMVKRIE